MHKRTSLYMSAFIGRMSGEILVPVFPLYLIYIGLSPTDIGIMFAVPILFQVILSPLAGVAADRVGTLRVYVVGYMGHIVSYVFLGYSATVFTVYATRVLTGASSAFAGMMRPLIRNMTPRTDWATTFAKFSSYRTAAGLFGPTLGAWVIAIYPGQQGYSICFYISALLCFVALLLVFDFARQCYAYGIDEPMAEQPMEFSTIPWTKYEFMLLCIGLAIPLCVLNGMQRLFPIYLHQHMGWSESGIGILYSSRACVMIFAQYYLISALERWALPSSALLGSVAVIACAHLVMGIVPEFPVIIMMNLVIPVAMAVFSAMQAAQIANLTGSAQAGRIFGFFNGASLAAESIGPLILGGLVDATNIAFLPIGGGLLAMVALLPLTLFWLCVRSVQGGAMHTVSVAAPAGKLSEAQFSGKRE